LVPPVAELNQEIEFPAEVPTRFVEEPEQIGLVETETVGAVGKGSTVKTAEP
jgi:hypothetical protein